MTTLRLPALAGDTIHGWLATLGASRILATRYPTMTLHYDLTTTPHHEQVTPVLTGGPATIAELADVLMADTMDRIPDGGVLPDLGPDYPPAGSRWWRHHTDPPIVVQEWENDPWQAALISASGLLTPWIRPHAAQTIRGMIATAGDILRKRPGLLSDALDGLGLDRGYPGGLWLLSTWSPGDDAPTKASPGRDWLALMALPWLPVHDEPTYEPGQPPCLASTPGSRWRLNYDGSRRWVHEWHLWSQPVPVSALPYMLSAPPAYLLGQRLRCGCYRPARKRRFDPPVVKHFTRREVADGAMDDARVVTVAEVLGRTGIRSATLRGYLSRKQCPPMDAKDGWRPGTIEPWLQRTKRPGARTDRRREA